MIEGEIKVIPDLRDEKFKILMKVIKELDKDCAKSLARNSIKPVNESADALEIILACLSLNWKYLTLLKR